jgi:hypothetical protein
MSLFRRTKSEPVDTAPAKPGGKGRPTPTRKEAEALAKAKARLPRDKKELAARARQVKSENSRVIREAMKTGDERYLLPRDKGPVRRFIRDYVDSRFSIVELLIPLLIVTLVLQYTAAVGAASLVMMATFLFVIVDMVLLRFRVKKELTRRFPNEPLKGTTYYAVMRSLQMKFMRMPKSKVKIGQELPDDYR